MNDTGTTGSAAARYAALEPAREPFLIRARQAASLTKPYLMPPLGFNSTMQLPTPFQSLGARGVRNLASKLVLALFPSNTPFFKYEIDDFLLEKLGKDQATRGDFDTAMNRRERAIMVEINKSRFRPEAYTSFEHLICSGNYLIHCPEKDRVRGFRLDQYVVRRDPSGLLLEWVVKEPVNPAVLSPLDQAKIAVRQFGSETDGSNDKHHGTGDKHVDLYTRGYLTEDGKRYELYQECQGIELSESRGSYPVDKCPWLALRFSSQPCEDYGRGYVEEFLGDLDSLEALSETLVEGTAAVARVIFLVKPSGSTRVEVVARARNGDVKSGNAEDVTVVQAAHKSADFQTALKQAETIATRLSYAFMLNSSVQRNGERVTAEEIRYMAGELDDALGGVYTLMADDYQLPIVEIHERRMMRRKGVPPLPKDIAEPTITTGLQAIGRGTDLQNMKAFVTEIIVPMAQADGTVMKRLNQGEFIKRAGAGYSLDMNGLVKSDAEFQQELQQEKQAEMAQTLGPHAIKAAGGLAQTAMQGAQAQEGNQQ